MFYRCRVCQHKESRGWLPTASCGMYALALLALSLIGNIGIVRGARSLTGAGSSSTMSLSAELAGASWLTATICVIAGLVLTVILAGVGMIVINFALELAEWLAFARRKCPVCGARRWSWGFTRGFGL